MKGGNIALLRPRNDFYTRSHPTLRDVFLLIEVAESNLRYDRDLKLPLYARHGIPAVWLVDFQNKQLLMFSKPVATGFQTTETADIGGPITLPGLADCTVDLAGLF